MIDANRVKILLGDGLGPTAVAQTLGCDPSYISQFLMDDTFRQEVLALRIQNMQAATRRDREIDSIEDELIEKLKENIKYMTKTNDIIRAFQILNAAKRRGAVTSGDITQNNTVVAIVLPPAARQKFTTNEQGEVVQVGEQVTTTMPLQNLLKQRLLKKPEPNDRTGEESLQPGTIAGAGEKAVA